MGRRIRAFQPKYGGLGGSLLPMAVALRRGKEKDAA